MKEFGGTERMRCKNWDVDRGTKRKGKSREGRTNSKWKLRGFVDKVTGLEIGITVIVKNEQI